MKKSIFILLAGTLLTVGGGILAPALSPIGKVQAQTGKFTVDGSVRDDKGMPVIGASVIVKGTNTGVTTDLDGNFTLAAPYSEATLTGLLSGLCPAGDSHQQPHASRHRSGRGCQSPRKRRRRRLHHPEESDHHGIGLDHHHTRTGSVAHGQHQQCTGGSSAGSGRHAARRRRTGLRRGQCQHPRCGDLRQRQGADRHRRRNRTRHELPLGRRDRDLHHPQGRFGDRHRTASAAPTA